MAFSLFVFGFSTYFLLIYFSMNLDPIYVIFDFVNSSLSYLSKNIKIRNFLIEFIGLFDRIPYFSVDWTLIHLYTL